MRPILFAFALALLPSVALAQPLDPPVDDTQPQPPPPPDPPPQPDPPPPPVVVAPAVEDEPDPAQTGEPKPTHPEEFSIGIGFGWALPADVQAPNTTSARFRLPSGLTFEPQLELERSATKIDTGTPPDTESATTVMGLAALVRKPLITHGRFDFTFLGGAGFRRTVVDPDGADNDTISSTFAIVYGAAVDFWVNPHFQVSMNALNPIFAVSSESDEMGPGMTTDTSQTAFGLTWDPSIAAMLHLYY